MNEYFKITFGLNFFPTKKEKKSFSYTIAVYYISKKCRENDHSSKRRREKEIAGRRGGTCHSDNRGRIVQIASFAATRRRERKGVRRVAFSFCGWTSVSRPLKRNQATHGSFVTPFSPSRELACLLLAHSVSRECTATSIVLDVIQGRRPLVNELPRVT